MVFPISNPIHPTGGVVGLKGNLAPEGGIVKIAGLKELMFEGPARVFDGEQAAFEAVQKRAYEDGEVLRFAMREPKAAPVCAKCSPQRQHCMGREPETK